MTEKELTGKMNDFCKTQNLTKAQMSREMGVDAGTLGNILKGNRGISVSMLIRFLETYSDVSAEWLLRNSGTMFNEPKVSESTITGSYISGDNNNNSQSVDKELYEQLNRRIDTLERLYWDIKDAIKK